MLKNELILKIEDSFKEKIIKTEAITYEVTLLSFQTGKVIVKRVSNKVKNIYDYLASQECNMVLYPIKQFVLNGEVFFLYKYMPKYDYPDNKKIYELLDAMSSLHQKTGFVVRLNDDEFKYFYRIYKQLDRIFQTLEMLVRESESKPNKTDNDWILLSKYKTFMKLKNLMYQIQRKIHKYVDSKGSVIYALNHGNLCINHIIRKKLISFDKSYIGIFVSDYAKLYVSIDDIEGEWFKEFDKKLSEYNNDFYKLYFKFLVLYIYLINVKFSDINNFGVINSYNQIENKINRFLILTASYQ